ncbi:AraC family transcriptional regulator [Pseudophaeobacter leonis]|uniref:AraC family transcriptional regulator n=1 Tax=Pseudophaeobacter leonis TaxID=1144477 RepID=UPI001374788A|nr:AraC family transcriptional regulator [Pseudophaeobacter leonis]
MIEDPSAHMLAHHCGPQNAGVIPTKIDGLRMFWGREGSPAAPLIYDSGIVLVFQGRKVGYLGDRQFIYDPANYLVLTMPVPFECATEATLKEPLFGLFVDLRRQDLIPLIAQMEEAGFQFPDCAAGEFGQAVAPAPVSPEMDCAAGRLLRSLSDPVSTALLGPQLRREVLYHALRGPRGPALVALTRYATSDDRIDRVVRTIQRDIARTVTVDTLAGEAGMSTSAFHRTFRETTGHSPLQYLKRMRLHAARRMIAFDAARVGDAAHQVGYESLSQFSREYRRLFGEPPTSARASASTSPEAFVEPMVVFAPHPSKPN